MQTFLVSIGAALLFVTAGYHLTGLRQVSDGLSGERRGLTRAAWIVVALDWIAVGAAWMAVAFGYFPGEVALWTAVLPLLGAMVLACVLHPGFPGVWLLFLAAVFGAGSVLIDASSL